MGTWSEGIYDDDEAQDARDAYRELLSQGIDGAQATDRFLKDWTRAMKDTDDGPVIWFALAETQWQLGRLEDRVRDAAIRLIDDGSSLDRWREAGQKALTNRQRVLGSLKEKLLSPQPKRKKINVEVPLKQIVKGQRLKPSELRKQLRALYCSLEPTRGNALTSVICRGDMSDALLTALEICASSLEELHVADSPNVTKSGLASIGRLTNLKRLRLRGFPLSDAHLAGWGDLKLLEILEIHGEGITDAGLACFSVCSNLNVLELGATSVSDKTLAWVSKRPAVRQLWLCGTPITDQGLGKLTNHAGLRQLYLGRTRISDRSDNTLASIKNLTYLDLADTAITNKTIATLTMNRSIRGLDLANTALTDECVPSLLKMKQVCYLNVERTKISQAGNAKLTEGLPELGNSKALNEMF